MARRVAWVLAIGAALAAGADEDVSAPVHDLTNFVPSRIEYDSVGGIGEAWYYYEGRLWARWETDFPQAERNFAKRLTELTSIVAAGTPAQVKRSIAGTPSQEWVENNPGRYARLAAEHLAGLREITPDDATMPGP